MRKAIIKVTTCFVFLLSLSLAATAEDITVLTMEGAKLNAEQVTQLEEEIQQNPDDIAIRTKLLGYYSRKRFKDQSAKAKRQTHILWLIDNAPESAVLGVSFGSLDIILEPSAYGDGKKAWLKKLEEQPKNLKFLQNSANFFMQHDRALAKKSLKKAVAIDDKNPKWPDGLGQMYELDMIGRMGESKTEAAAMALQQLEIAYDLTDGKSRDPLLSRLAKTAFEAGQSDKAKKYALKMLSQQKDDWNAGNNLHNGNIILGRIALAEGNVEDAKRHLLAAAKTDGSPQLNSFGPNMSLANDLLKMDETEVVLEYFDLCSKFWEMGKDRLQQWSATVKEGGTPDFKGTLYY